VRSAETASVLGWKLQLQKETKWELHLRQIRRSHS